MARKRLKAAGEVAIVLCSFALLVLIFCIFDRLGALATPPDCGITPPSPYCQDADR
ncbi:MAG: hypothetical protein KBC15_02940 [Candidatus Levybacteria bacterium]|nr:hypothetical protein [Candidatus Levybacteria bacterium]